MEDEKMNNDVTNPLKNGRMSAKEFWIRFSSWLAFAVVAPVVYIAAKYGIFTSHSTEYRLTGWGIIASIIVAVFLITAAKEAMHGLPRGSMIRQCITGFIRILPLFLLLLLVNAIKDSIEAFRDFLIVVIACEAVAVPINPFPKWSAQNNVDMAEKSMFMAFSRAFSQYAEKDRK